LRRALGRLARAGIPDALPHVLKLTAYVPSLTPWAIRYVIAAGASHIAEALQVMDDIVAKVSHSDWQRLWLLRGLDELSALAPEAPGDSQARVRWVSQLRHSRCGPSVVAEAAMALASVSEVEFAELEYALRNQPAALSAWYLKSIARLHQRGDMQAEQYAAVRGHGGLYAALLPVAP